MRKDLEFALLCSSGDLVKPEYFSDQTLIWLYKTVRDYLLDYHKLPTQVVIQEELRKDVELQRIKLDLAKFYEDLILQTEKQVQDTEYIKNKIINFCKRQAVHKALYETSFHLDSDDDEVWANIPEPFIKAANIGKDNLALGHDYFSDMAMRLAARLADQLAPIPTCIPDLDYILGGGIKPTQLGVWLGSTSIGKSIALLWCATQAVLLGKKVIYYSLELTEDEIGERADAAINDTPVYALKANQTIIEQRLISLAANHTNSFIIKYYPPYTVTVNTIRAHLSLLKSKGIIPDMIVIDYAELLNPTESRKNLYDDQGHVYISLKGLAVEQKVVAWTAAQANRTAYTLDIVDNENTGDSIKKAQIAQINIGMSASLEDRRQGILTLNVAKNKNGPEKQAIKIYTDYEKMILYKGPVMMPTLPTPDPGDAPYNGNGFRRKPRGH